MSRKWWLKTALILFLFLGACLLLMPTVVEMGIYPEKINDNEETLSDDSARVPALPDWYTSLPNWMTSKTLALGLDLQGGMMLRYSVDIDSALDEKLGRFAADIKRELAEKGVSLKDYRVDRENDRINLMFNSEDDMAVINKDFLDNFQNLNGYKSDSTVYTLELRKDFVKENEEASIKTAVEIVRDRIDELGVASPSVRVEGGRNIVVELPGLSKKRAASAERLISTTAVLTFKLVADSNQAIQLFQDLYDKLPENSAIKPWGGSLSAQDVRDDSGRTTRTGKDILKTFITENESMIPSGREIAYEKISQRELKAELDEGVDVNTYPTVWRIRLVRTDLPSLTGDNVDNAYPASNPDTGVPYVSLKLDKRGGDTFYELTKQHVGEQLAILMDDVLVSDPVIRSEIPGGNVSIEMGAANRNETLDEVNNLVVSLRSGALPAPIRQEFKTMVGPSLGRDSIEKGAISLAIGFALVVITMIFYYRGAGFYACVALLLNLIFILAGMAGMGAALTMPGIAGIVLTVGMAVDANVIIFERIREEMRAGETPRKSAQIGYEKALWTILDSNITTAIAAIILMELGSGPVKGFAVTLLLGIICSVYTAFNVTRSMFEVRLHKDGSKLSL